jgi:hypothetical protein
MTRYLISFDDGAMTFSEEVLPDVAKAAQDVVQETKHAGVWVFGGGVKGHEARVVATDGSVTDGPYRQPHSARSLSVPAAPSICGRSLRAATLLALKQRFATLLSRRRSCRQRSG